MDKVSSAKITDEEIQIESKYLDINYNISENRSNIKLDCICGDILKYMALTDASYDGQDKENKIFKTREMALKEKIFEALAICKTEEDFQNFKKFISEISSVGGYAAIFCPEVITMVNPLGRNQAIQELNKINRQRKEPVSRKNGNEIESKYFSVLAREIKSKNFESDLKDCLKQMVKSLVMADIERDSNSIELLDEAFFEALSKCKTEEEIQNFNLLMMGLSVAGGYAIEYEDRMHKYMNENGRDFAVNREKKNKLENKQLKLKQSLLEQWEKKFKNLSILLEEFKSKRIKDENEILYLLHTFRNLQEELYYISSVVDKKYMAKMDFQLNECIEYLKKTYRILQEPSNIRTY